MSWGAISLKSHLGDPEGDPGKGSPPAWLRRSLGANSCPGLQSTPKGHPLHWQSLDTEEEGHCGTQAAPPCSPLGPTAGLYRSPRTPLSSAWSSAFAARVLGVHSDSGVGSGPWAVGGFRGAGTAHGDCSRCPPSNWTSLGKVSAPGVSRKCSAHQRRMSWGWGHCGSLESSEVAEG